MWWWELCTSFQQTFEVLVSELSELRDKLGADYDSSLQLFNRRSNEKVSILMFEWLGQCRTDFADGDGGHCNLVGVVDQHTKLARLV
jgi:hypothetical protein